VTESTSVQPVRVRLVQSSAEFASLAADWEALQKDASSTSVFQTFDWQYIWWTTYGCDQPLRLLLATEGDRLVGILPLYIQTVRTMLIPVHILRPVGIGGDTWPDDLGPVLAAGCEVHVAQALAAAVMQLPGWDVLQLSDMLPDWAFATAIRSEIEGQGLPLLTGRSERISYLDLPSTWEGWLEGLSRDRRWRVRSLRKKMYAAHSTRFLVWSDPDTLDAAIDRLAFLHNKRWNAVGEVHGFATPEYIGFHRGVMRACLQRDRLRLYCLEVAGQIVAMYYFYQFRNRVYLMQSGYDPDFSKLKPGQVLLHHIIEHAIGEGRSVLDFLRGDHRYKDELATGERETVYVTAFRLTVGALAHHVRRIVMPAAKARLMEELEKRRPQPTKAE
jgi:CelD/BcsL family acetyltransferase involved in cellulose biosynthesis